MPSITRGSYSPTHVEDEYAHRTTAPDVEDELPKGVERHLLSSDVEGELSDDDGLEQPRFSVVPGYGEIPYATELNCVVGDAGGGSIGSRRRGRGGSYMLAAFVVLAVMSVATVTMRVYHPRHSGGLLLNLEATAAYERLNHMLKEANIDIDKIDVQEPGGLKLDQMKLAYTQCTIDVVQASAYLGSAIIFIDKAVNYGGAQCPDETKEGCAVQIEAAVTAMIWLASYISLAMSSCTATVNAPAACAADITGIMANVGELATASTAASVDCKFEKKRPWDKLKPAKVLPALLGRRLTDTAAVNHTDVGRRLAETHPLADVVASMKAKAEERQEAKQEHYERQVDEALCAFDVVQGVSYVVRALKQSLGAAVDTCADPFVCSINMLNIISSVAWISQFFSFAAADCAVEANQAAYCSGDVSDLIAATASIVAVSMAVPVDCEAAAEAVDQGFHSWGGNTEVDEIQEGKRRLHVQ